MKECLEKLNKTSGIMGSLIVGRDGLVIDSVVPAVFNADLVGAIVAGVFTSAESSMEELHQGDLDMIMVECTIGKLILCNIGAILVVLLGEDINLGIVRLDIRKAIQELKEFL